MELSLRNNSMNKVVSRFKSPFLDTIEHARNQYLDLGCPPKPKPAEVGHKKKTDAFLDWEKVAQQTLETTHLNVLNWILYAKEDLYELWRKVCNKWMTGELKGPDGLEGKPHKIEQVTPKLFKCFEGDIEGKTIKNILKKILDGRILFKKDFSNKSSVLCMEDLAKASKFFKAIRSRVIKYLTEKYPDGFPQDITWHQVVKKLPELEDEEELNRLRLIAGKEYAMLLTAKNKKELPFPNSLQSTLNVIVAINLGITLRDRKMPFVVVGTEDLCKHTIPNLVNENPDCPCAIVDFARRDQKVWSTEQLQHFFTYIASYTRCKVITIALFVQPGALMARVLEVVYSNNGYSSHLEFGTYEGPENRWRNPEMVINDQREILLLIGLSSESNTNWTELYANLTSLHFSYDPELDKDFDSSFPNKDIPAQETHEEKEERAKEEHLRSLRLRAPRYDMCGESGGWVNPESKLRSIVRGLIKLLSSKDQTIFDFFSSGIVLKESLCSGRECIAFSDTPKESLFLESYPHTLRQLKIVDNFFHRVEKMAQGEKVPVPEEKSNDPSENVAVEGNVTLIKYKRDTNVAATSAALANLGILKPADGAGPSSRGGLDLQATSVQATDIAVQEKAGVEAADKDDTNLDQEAGEIQDEVGSEANSQAIDQGTAHVDQTADAPQSTSVSSMMGEVNPNVPNTDEAGANHPNSPNLSHYSILS